MTSKTDIQTAVKRIRARVLWSQGAVLFALGSAVSTGLVILFDSGTYAAFSLVSPLLLFLIQPSNSRLIRLVDQRCSADGVIECAWDNLKLDTPIVLAQRRRALGVLSKQPISAIAPLPSPAWTIPIGVLGVALFLHSRTEIKAEVVTF